MLKLRNKLTGVFRAEKTRERGESLIGTMIGVLLLSIVLSSFAGIFLGASKSSSTAKESSARLTVVTTDNSQGLSDGRVDSGNVPTGWSQEKPGTGYSYAIRQNVGASSTLVVHQWGVNTNGVITLYTAMAKSGSTFTCDSNAAPADLANNCIVAFGSAFSTVNPPVSGSTGNWRNYVNIEPWCTSVSSSCSSASADYTQTTPTTFVNGSSFTLNSAEPKLDRYSARTLNFVIKFDTASTTTRYIQVNTNTSALNNAATVAVGTAAGYYYGTITIPGDESNPVVSITGSSTTPTINNFVISTSKTSS